MTTRHYGLMACGLGVCLVAAQIVIKPRPVDATSHETDAIRRNLEWRGRPAPAFDLPLRDGSTFRPEDHTGRQVVVLTFFTTWCRECGAELFELDRYVRFLQREHRPVVAVGIDGQEQAELVNQFSAQAHLTLPIAIDEAGDVMRAFDVVKFPTTVVIGAAGRVELYVTDDMPNPEVALGATLEQEFNALLQPKRM